MLTSEFRKWFQKRISVADKVLELFGKEGEPDAEIILLCVTSALAATMWPGEGKDQKRFVEFLIKFAPSESLLQRVSVCLLIQYLGQKGNKQIADQLIDHFFSSRLNFYSRSPYEYGGEGSGLFAGTLPPILAPEKIDVTETDIIAVVPGISEKLVRKFSYANILYSDMRSGLVHEYELSNNLAESGWHRGDDRISYINFLVMPDELDVDRVSKEYGITQTEARVALSTVRRSLYFPYRYIRETIAGTANAAFDHWDIVGIFSQPDPSTWWVDG